MTDRVGQQFGNYQLVKLLGYGGCAEVYLGKHRYLNSYAALKVSKAAIHAGDEQKFLAEAQRLVDLRHPHIVHLLDFGIENGTPMLIMDYAPKGSLRQQHPAGTQMPLTTVVDFVAQIAAALQYAHNHHVIHRDVKPENILLDVDNRLLLSDFGLSLLTPSSEQLSTQDPAGTARYMAPEQLRGKPGFASDQYALAIMVYDWLCGDFPFHGNIWEIWHQHMYTDPPPLRTMRPELPLMLENVVTRALAKTPQDRFVSIQAFARALARASQTDTPVDDNDSQVTVPLSTIPYSQPLGVPHKTGRADLPMDYSTRIKNFLTEYLGTPANPVPFGGRTADILDLNSWLDTPQSPPYLLLVTSAGRGKSALLVRWEQQLKTRKDVEAVFMPISIRFRTNSANIVFTTIIEYLASLQGEKIAITLNTPSDVLQQMVTHYLARPLPDKRRLLLILDGIDEAADWEVSPILFPLPPPEGLRVVLSARYLAEDPSAKRWLIRLGWDHTNKVRVMNLGLLTYDGIANVLLQMGSPLSHLGAQADVVTELYRLSKGGDPLLLRLYVEYLWNRGDETTSLDLAELRTIDPGLGGYFYRWLEDQRRLWGSQTPLREPAVQALLDLLACALGPLSQEDVLDLAPPEVQLTTWRLKEEVLPSLKRFVLGDGEEQGYSFCHPELGTYFRERLSQKERRRVEQRILALAQKTILALNEAKLLPSEASPYIVRHYSTYIEKMMLPAEAFLPLVSDGWRKAWEALEGTDTGFLNEVIKTWQAAERHDELMVKDNQIALFISCEVRCALCQASVNSLTRNIPPSLLILLVKTGIWTSVQGLAYAKLLSEPEQQVKVLVELVPRLPDNLRLEVCLHALTIAEEMEDERDKAEALSKITPLLPGLIVIRVLNMARIMTYEECQVKVLMGVGQISHISPEILENALSIVSNINDEECRVKALAALSLKLSDELKSTLLHEALGIVRTIQNESYLVEVLCSLIPFLQDEFLEEALMAYTLLSSENNKIHLIKTIAPYAPEALQRKILEVVKDLKSDMGRIDVLFAIIPLLSGKLVLDVLPIINLFKDIKLQMDSVRDIIYLIYGKAIENAIKSQIDNLKDLGELFELARTILSDYDHLINKKLEQDFFLAKAIENARERVEAIAAQIPRLPENIKVEALKEAIKAAKSTKGKLRVELLTRLAPFLPQAQQLEILKEALRVTRVIDDVQGFSSIMQPIPSILMEETKIAREIPQVTDPFQKIQILEDEEQKLKMLIDSLPLLTEMQLPKLLRLIRMIEDEGYKTEIMLELIPTLPQALLPEVLKLVQRIEDEGCRTELLVRLTPLLPQSLIPVALGLAGTLSYSRDRIRVLAGLASILSEQQKVELLKEAKMLKDEGFRVEVLVKLNPFLALDMIRDSRDERLQARTLVEHLSKLPEISDALGKEALNIIKNMSHAKHQVEAIEGLVPYLSETLRVQIIEVMRSIEDERYRTQALIRLGLLTQLPQELQENAFTILRSMKNERYQAQALIDLVPQLSEALKTEVLVIVRSMKNERHQAQALIGLVPQLSEALKTEVLAIVRSMKNERYQAQALIGLVPQLSEALKTEVLATTVRSMKNERYQVETVVGLANFLAELPLVELYTIWSRVIHTLAHYTRQQFLLDLPHLSPIISTLGGTKAITEIDITVQEIRKWWP